MIDPVPVGYVALDQAVTRLARDIPDQDFGEEYRRIEEKSRHFESENENLAKEDAPFTWSNFPEAERDRIAEQQKAADISWAKREIAISRLYAALCDGGLTGLVCEDQNFFQLTPVDWCSVAFWHEVIISGVVRASAGDAIARHSGRRVLIEDAAFDTWLQATLKRKAQAAAAEGPKTAGTPGGSPNDEAVAQSNKRTSHINHGHGESTPPRQYLTAPQICQRYNISDMTLWRWLQDTKLAFPQPALRIRDRRYWLEGDLVCWERSHGEGQT